MRVRGVGLLRTVPHLVEERSVAQRRGSSAVDAGDRESAGVTGFRVREAGPADYEAVRRCIDEVYRETAAQKAQVFDRALWEWQYLRNELPALIVVAERDGGLCGYLHALRFRMRFRGQLALGALLTDLGTLSAYRRQGVFRAMADFLLERLRAEGVDVLYLFPNARKKSLPGFVRNHGFTVVARVPVYVAPLDLGALLASHLRLGAAGQWLGQLLNPLVRALTLRTPALDRAEEVVRLDQIDVRLEPLVRDCASGQGVSLERNLRYLRWRFLDKPTGDYTVWALARGGRLCAYVVTRQARLFDTRCTVLMDFGCLAGEDAALRRLVRTRLEADQRDGAALGVTMGLHPQLGELSKVGFVRVPEPLNPRPLNLITREFTQSRPELFDPSAWHITLADWDVF